MTEAGPDRDLDRDRDRDRDRRPRNARPRDGLGRPLPRGSSGVERHTEGVHGTPDETLDEGRRLFQAGLPFHAHEVFEDAWKATGTPERELWRGLAQLAVGVTHAARGNQRGAIALLNRAATTIAASAPSAPSAPSGLDVRALLTWIEDSVALVEVECPVILIPSLR